MMKQNAQKCCMLSNSPIHIVSSIRCIVKLGGFLRMPQNLAKSPSCFDVFTKRLVNVQVNVKTSGRFPKKCPEDFEEEGIS